MEDVERGLATEVKHLKSDLRPAIAELCVEVQFSNGLLKLVVIDQRWCVQQRLCGCLRCSCCWQCG